MQVCTHVIFIHAQNKNKNVYLGKPMQNLWSAKTGVLQSDWRKHEMRNCREQNSYHHLVMNREPDFHLTMTEVIVM